VQLRPPGLGGASRAGQADGGEAGGSAGPPGGAGPGPGEEEADLAGEGETEEEAAARRGEAEVQERLRDQRYYGALSLLCDEAGFLVDAKVRMHKECTEIPVSFSCHILELY
jgi:hypothetical protein